MSSELLDVPTSVAADPEAEAEPVDEEFAEEELLVEEISIDGMCGVY
jgi:mycofactocin precursor